MKNTGLNCAISITLTPAASFSGLNNVQMSHPVRDNVRRFAIVFWCPLFAPLATVHCRLA